MFHFAAAERLGSLLGGLGPGDLSGSLGHLTHGPQAHGLPRPGAGRGGKFHCQAACGLLCALAGESRETPRVWARGCSATPSPRAWGPPVPPGRKPQPSRGSLPLSLMVAEGCQTTHTGDRATQAALGKAPAMSAACNLGWRCGGGARAGLEVQAGPGHHRPGKIWGRWHEWELGDPSHNTLPSTSGKHLKLLPRTC